MAPFRFVAWLARGNCLGKLVRIFFGIRARSSPAYFAAGGWESTTFIFKTTCPWTVFGGYGW